MNNNDFGYWDTSSRRRNRRRNITYGSSNRTFFGILAVIVSVVTAAIAYAGFTQTLNITGSGKVVSSKWDIHFENLSNASLNGSARVVTAPTITSATTIGTYSVQLLGPGDSVSYTFDVVNDGNFNARLTTLTKNTPSCTTGFNCNNLTYSLYISSSISPTLTASFTAHRGSVRWRQLEK